MGSAILAVSALAVYYSQEARMEVAACFFGIAAAYALTRAIQGKRSWHWFIYGFAASACLYTFYYAGFVLAGLNLAVLLRRKKPPKAWWAANVVAVALWAPWVALAYRRLPAFLGVRLTDLHHPSALSMLRQNTVGLLFGITANPAVSWIPALGILALSLMAAYRLLQKPGFLRWTFLAWALAPTLAIDALSFALPVFQARYF